MITAMARNGSGGNARSTGPAKIDAGFCVSDERKVAIDLGARRPDTTSRRLMHTALALARRHARRWWPAGAALMAFLLAAGCSTVPDSGAVQAGQVGADQAQSFFQVIPVPPKPGWSPTDIVSGFLAASASFAGNHAAARQYLAPEAAGQWNPTWAVTVVGTDFGVGLLPAQPYRRQSGEVDSIVRVRATGAKLAFLTDNGQYVGGKLNPDSTWLFILRQVNQQWRIVNPPRYLMLTAPDFQRVYQPRNLYFLAGTGQALVPYPVFVPLEATSLTLTNLLVHALLQDPGDWLTAAATTAVPAGTKLARPVTINGGIATVDLGGTAVTASPTALREMAAQLIWTLAGPSAAPLAIQSVQLEVNGRSAGSASWSGGQPQQKGPRWPSVPEPRPGIPAYSLTSDGAVQILAPRSLVPQPVPGQAGQGRQPLNRVAVSPDGHYVAGLTRWGHVYIGAVSASGQLKPWGQGGGFTSVSWDHRDDLWVAGPEGVWLVSATGGQDFSVLGLPPGYQVRKFLVAPDEVRVAMILAPSGGGAAQLRLGAITQTGNQPPLASKGNQSPLVGKTVPIGSGVPVPGPTDLTWYDADHLIALSGSQLWEVPVNGGDVVPIDTYPGTDSISAAGPANPLLAGLTDGRLVMAKNVNGAWATVRGAGWNPAYPG